MARIPLEPSPFSSRQGVRFSEPEQRGLDLFRDNCAGCHQLLPSTAGGHPLRATALPRQLRAGRLVLTSAQSYDVGTPVLGEGGNNPPSLRNTWAAAPYFSDGSAATLEEVVRRTDPKAPRVHAAENLSHAPGFSPEQQAALVTFLRGL
jgi:cytochrome c peroxidase